MEQLFEIYFELALMYKDIKTVRHTTHSKGIHSKSLFHDIIQPFTQLEWKAAETSKSQRKKITSTSM